MSSLKYASEVAMRREDSEWLTEKLKEKKCRDVKIKAKPTKRQKTDRGINENEM